MNNRKIILAFLSIIIISCTPKIETAKESLIGEWSVNEIYSSSSGITIEDKNAIGQFSISPETVDYEFTLEGEQFSNSFSYTFEVSKENAGFTRIDRFDIVGNENYRVRFGDETSDAHENANMMSLEREIMMDSLTTTLLLILEKN